MRMYSPFNNLAGSMILPCFAMALLLVASFAPREASRTKNHLVIYQPSRQPSRA